MLKLFMTLFSVSFLLLLSSEVYCQTSFAVLPTEKKGNVTPEVMEEVQVGLNQVLLESNRYRLLDRQRVNSLFKGQAFQLTGTDQHTISMLGKILNVEKFIHTILYEKQGNQLALQCSVIDVRTGQTEMVKEISRQNYPPAHLGKGCAREIMDAYPLVEKTTPAGGNDLCSPRQQSASALAAKAAFPYQGSFDQENKRITVRVKKAGSKVSLSRQEKASLQFLTVADDRGKSCFLRSPSFAREKAIDGCDEVSLWVARYAWDSPACSAVQNPVIFIPGARRDLHAPPPQAPLPIKPELVAHSQEKAFSPDAIQCPEISAPRMFRWRMQNNRAIMEVDTAPPRFEKNGIAADDCMHTGLDALDFYYCRHPFSAEGSAISAYTLVFDGPRLVFSIFDGSWTGADGYTQFNYDRQDIIASYAVGETKLYVFRAGYVLYRDGNNWRASYRDSFLYTGATECYDESDEEPADDENNTGAASCDDLSDQPGQDPRFQKAYALKDSGKYQEALVLFQQKIDNSPKACYIDYYYGWATFCLAHLDRLEEALGYYRIMRTRFPGDTEGAGGANRNWDNVLERVRDVVAASRQPKAKEILKQMRELDKISPSLQSPRRPREQRK